MKLLFLAILASIQLQWDANPATDQVTGYNLKWGVNSAPPFPNSLALGNVTTCTFSNVSTGKEYKFAVTATNATAESSYSNIVTVLIPAAPTVRTILSGPVEIR